MSDPSEGNNIEKNTCLLKDTSKAYGMWEINYSLDKKDGSIKNAFITNSEIIKGEFTNPYTRGSEFGVKFIIIDKDTIGLKLFEYMNDQHYDLDGLFYIYITDDDNSFCSLKGNNSIEYLAFSDSVYYGNSKDKIIAKNHSRHIWSLLNDCKKLYFLIEHSKYTVTYRFSLKNEVYLDSIYPKLDYMKYKSSVY